MRELFVAMLKEEWRIHSTMTGNLGFALFPVMIAGFTFMAAWILPVLPGIVPIDTLSALNPFDYQTALRQISFVYQGKLTYSQGIRFMQK